MSEPSGAVVAAFYDLSADDARTLTAELLAERASTLWADHRTVGIEVEGNTRFANLGRWVERMVFESAFGNDATEMEREYGPYEASSVFFVSIDRVSGLPIGVIRVIRNSTQGFKSLNDAEKAFGIQLAEVTGHHEIATMATVWDVGTVAVMPEYRRGEALVSVQLYRAMYSSALQHGIDHFVSIIDDRPLRHMTGILGMPFIALAGCAPGPYLGSAKSQAVYGYVPDFHRRMTLHLAGVKGLLTRNALERLVNGTEDDAISLSS